MTTTGSSSSLVIGSVSKVGVGVYSVNPPIPLNNDPVGDAGVVGVVGVVGIVGAAGVTGAGVDPNDPIDIVVGVGAGVNLPPPNPKLKNIPAISARDDPN